MKLQDVDALKAWLANAVSLICDAEPDDLAKYIVALIKKDKTDKELEDLCQKELQVFFKENTMEFLSKLFTTLKTESYIAESQQKFNRRAKREMSPIKMESNVLRNRPVMVKDDEKNEGSAKKFNRHDSGESMRSKQSRNDNRDVRSRLEDVNSRDYKRLSSRDDNERRERRRRSRSRDRSPFYRRRFGSGRHHDELRSGRLKRRSRGRSRSKDRTTRSPFNEAGFRSAKYFAPSQKSGSPFEERNRYDQQVDKTSPVHSRSSSIDLKDDTNYRITVPLDNLMGHGQGSVQNVQPSYQGYGNVPVQDTSTSIGSGFLGPPPTLTVPPHQMSLPIQSSSSPLSLPSVVITAASHSGSSIPDTSTPLQIPYDTSPCAVPRFAAPSKMFSTMPVILTQPPPVLHAHQQFAQFPHPGVNYQSPSIIIPKDSTNSSRQVVSFGATPAVFAFQEQSQSSVKSRLGMKVDMDGSQWLSSSTSSSGCTLLISNIPPSFNNISSINQQFSKFGAITNIQVQYAGNPGSALISFVTHESAEAAYTSSEPVFNNRFIEVLWHHEDLQTSRIVIPEMRRSVKERLGACLPDMKLQVQGNSPSTATVLSHSHNKETEKASNVSTNNLIAQVDTAKQQRTVLLMPSNKTTTCDAQSKLTSQVTKSSQFSKIKRNTPYNKLNLDLINEVKKRKFEWYEKNSLFLKEQLQKQKSLLEELRGPGLSTEEKLTIKKKLKELSQESEKLKSELDKTMKSARPSTSANVIFPTNATKLEIKKQILDAELDLISKAKDGTDTTELDKKINIMKSQAALMMKSQRKQTGPYKINKPYFKSFGKPNLRSTLSSTLYNIPQPSTRLLDRRPKQLLVTGFTSEKKNAVVAHLGRFGKMEKFVDGGDGSSIMVTYSTRKEAEKVAQLGSDFEGTKLKFAWPKSTENRAPPVPDDTTSSTQTIEMKTQDESSKKQRSVGEIEELEDEEDDDDDDSDTMIELVIEDDGVNDLTEQPYLDENDIDEESLLNMS